MKSAVSQREIDAAEVAANCANFRLRKTGRVLSSLYDAALRPSGLKGTQFSLLTALALMGPVPLCKLAERLTMDRTSLTRTIKPLLRCGLIEVSEGNDRRQRILALTTKGRDALESAMPLWKSAQSRVEDHLGKERLERLRQDLQSLAGVIEET